MESSTGSHIPSALATRDMSDYSGSMFQSLFDAALRNYEKQTGMKLIEHPLARKLENCNSVESITAVLEEQARAFSEFRRDDDKVMKPLKRVVQVLHSLSTDLVRRVALVATLLISPNATSTVVPQCKGDIYSFCHPAPRTAFSVSVCVSF